MKTTAENQGNTGDSKKSEWVIGIRVHVGLRRSIVFIWKRILCLNTCLWTSFSVFIRYMRSASVLPFVVTLLGVASAVPSPHSDIVVHETRVSATHWTKTGRLDSTEVLPMRFGLIQQNLHKLEEMLMSVSHPESPKYAQHFTPMEVIDAFAPSEETVSAVTNWLVDSGFPRDRLRLSANKGWIHLNASTSEVESLLNTEYHVYTHPSGDTQIGEECFYVRPKQMILFMVFRVPQLFSAKTSPTARRSHQTYCTPQSPNGPKYSAKARWRPGSTLLRFQSQHIRQLCDDHIFLAILQRTDYSTMPACFIQLQLYT